MSAKRTLRVAGGTIVSPRGSLRADVLCEGGRIAAVGNVTTAAERVVDASGCLVLPGGVDPHVHVFGAVEEDTRSALCGGTTTVVSFLDEPATPGETPAQALRRIQANELPRSFVDLACHAVIWEPDRYRPGDLAALAEVGVTSVKLWLAYRELGIMIGDDQALEVMREAASCGVLVLAHCENGPLVDALRERFVAEGRTALRWHAEARPIALEAEAVHRFLVIAGLAGADAYVVHVTGRASLEEIVRARRRGQTVGAEACSHHLVFSDDVYDRDDPVRFIMTPPLRGQGDRAGLWQGLVDGSIDTLASDHSHLRLDRDKRPGGNDFTRVPYGLPGIETRLVLGYTLGVEHGLISIERLVDLACEAPAKAFGLFPRKGTVAPGADADLVVWDPQATWTLTQDALHDALDYTPYEGIEVRGRPRAVVAAGEVVVEDGNFLGRSTPARYLARTRR